MRFLIFTLLGALGLQLFLSSEKKKTTGPVRFEAGRRYLTVWRKTPGNKVVLSDLKTLETALSRTTEDLKLKIINDSDIGVTFTPPVSFDSKIGETLAGFTLQSVEV